MKNFSLEPFDEETKILLQYVNDNFLIDKVEKVEFMIDIAGHELSVYDAKKMYIAKNIEISDATDTLFNVQVRFYNHANIIMFEATNSFPYWDSNLNQLHRITNKFNLKNILFSRLDSSQYYRFKMVGYRITLQ